MAESQFMQWAKMQFGARPGGLHSTESLRERAIGAERTALVARNIYDARVRWEARLNDALLGWSAKP